MRLKLRSPQQVKIVGTEVSEKIAVDDSISLGGYSEKVAMGLLHRICWCLILASIAILWVFN